MTTNLKTKHIGELHFEHQLWINEIKFFSDELKIYQNRLAEVEHNNNSADVRKQVEHFQNQFTIQKEQIDILLHQINEHENWLAKYAKENPNSIDKKLFANHAELIDKVATFKKIYSELKAEFTRFLSIWM